MAYNQDNYNFFETVFRCFELITSLLFYDWTVDGKYSDKHKQSGLFCLSEFLPPVGKIYNLWVS